MRLKGGQVAIALVCLVLGLMVSMQYRIQRNVASDLSLKRSEELTSMLKQSEDQRLRLEEEVAELREELARAAQGQNALSGLKNELNKARMLAGLTEVRGPGVVVVLDDSKRPRQPGEDPNVFILHDDDLLKVVNELQAAGAEAISINGQRLVAMSEIRCAGPTISINRTMTAPPVQILAIGDPEVLESALKLRAGILESLAFWGIEVSVKRETDIMIPAYKGSLRFQYAKTVDKEGGN